MGTLTGSEFCRILRRKGWAFASARGSHQKYVDANGFHIVVPVHAGKNLSLELQRDLMKQAGLTDADL